MADGLGFFKSWGRRDELAGASPTCELEPVPATLPNPGGNGIVLVRASMEPYPLERETPPTVRAYVMFSLDAHTSAHTNIHSVTSGAGQQQLSPCKVK